MRQKFKNMFLRKKRDSRMRGFYTVFICPQLSGVSRVLQLRKTLLAVDPGIHIIIKWVLP